MMRRARSSMALAAILGLAPAAGVARAQLTPGQLLKFSPTMKGVDADVPADKAALDACKAEELRGPDGKSFYGYALRDGQGRLLRRFIDSNAALSKREGEPKPIQHLDVWSYYQDGFEVYREVDLNEDGAPDEARWLNLGGTRIAAIEPAKGPARGYRVVAWRRISAEEASKVLVTAIVSGDMPLLETVMATPDELQSIGVPEAGLAAAAKAAGNRRAQLKTLVDGLKGWNSSVVWSRFDGTMPHVIPADPGGKATADVVLYENPIVFAGHKDPAQNPADLAYMQANEVVKVGDTWKFVDLPRAIDPKNPPQALAQEPGIRSWIYHEVGAPDPRGGGGVPPAILAKLDAFDKANTPGPNAKKREVAEYHVKRVGVLREIVAAATTPADRLNYEKEVVNSLAAAYQTDAYPEAAGVIEKFAEKEGGALASFATYRRIIAEFTLDADQPGADYLKVQKDCRDKLDAFVKKFPDSDEAPDAYYQLATMSEFSNDDAAARAYYATLAQKYPDADSGRKAAGAVRRLDLDGKPIALSGAGPKGRTLGTADYKGKTLLVLFWTTGADANRKDLPLLAKLSEKYQSKGFEILGINLDTDKATLADYLSANPLPWQNIEEPGGMAEGKLANEFGILSTPTMILVDASGKVVHRGVKSVPELERLLEKQLAGGPTASLSSSR